MTTSIDFRTCPLCEATCGLEVTHADEKIVRIRGDRDDVFSHGFICPKGSTLGKIDEDPDRVRTPLIKRDGVHEPATWDEAFALIESRLLPIIAEHGNSSVGVYLGNPNVHSMSGTLYPRVFLKMLGTKSIFSAATVDQMPKHVSSGLMFGHPDLIPVPDIDRTSYLLMLGANPYESNGSLATAPDWPGRLQAIRERGGKVVVVDPRRTRTADAADEHVFIRPGADALFLFALANVLFEEGLVDPGRLEGHIAGMDELAASIEAFTPDLIADATGVDPDRTRRLARELAGADSAAVYGRIGTHTAEFGTMASWMVDVLNVLTGNLDRPGGAMFSHAAHEQPRAPRGFQVGRWQSRVKGLPEVRGELPVSTMADEMLEPGPGQIRALVTIAGNPILSTPSSDRLDAALAASTSWCRSTSTSTRRPVTPTSSSPAPRRSAVPTTTSPSINWRCATWPTTRRPFSLCPTTPPTSGRCCSASGQRCPGRDGTPTSTPWTTVCSGWRSARLSATRSRPSTGATPRRSSRRRPATAMIFSGARRGCSTSWCAPVPTATAMGSIPRGSPWSA